MENVQVGAYFYPLAPHDQGRKHRALQADPALCVNTDEPIDELALAQRARPLFEGHDQPQTYCLPNTDGSIDTRWDDSDEATIIRQILLAKRYGLSYFTFDSYCGVRGGHPLTELNGPLTAMSKLGDLCLIAGFKYARMEVLEGSRMRLPIPYAPGGEQGVLSREMKEPQRQYDLSAETARAIR